MGHSFSNQHTDTNVWNPTIMDFNAFWYVCSMVANNPNLTYFCDRTVGSDNTGYSTFGIYPKYCSFGHHCNISNVRNFWTNKYIHIEQSRTSELQEKCCEIGNSNSNL